MVVGACGALILMRMVALDPKTALLATMPGGVIEMQNVAARVGADPLPITVLQTMRVGLTVCAAPFIVTWLVDDATRHAVTERETMSWLLLLALMAASFVGGLALYAFKLPNCWFLGSLLVMAALGALGLIEGRVPDLILVVAQVVIGVSIGTQYRHEFLTRLLRLLLASLVTVPFALIVLALLAAGYAVMLGFPIPTMILSLAPAGHRRDGADRQGAGSRRGADHRLPDRAHRDRDLGGVLRLPAVRAARRRTELTQPRAVEARAALPY